jgi:hypothetical protein
MGKYALGAWHMALRQTLKLMTGGDDGGRPIGRARAIRHGGFQAAGHNLIARRRHIIFGGAKFFAKKLVLSHDSRPSKSP